jgi:4a-hydroxytetrahydrobiopterin dehydratase
MVETPPTPDYPLPMSRLYDDEIRLVLKDLPDWRYFANALHKEFRFRGFQAAIAFVNRVADEAIAARHHPDIELHYDRVILSLTTHADGGVSAKDVSLARAIDKVVEWKSTSSNAN